MHSLNFIIACSKLEATFTSVLHSGHFIAFSPLLSAFWMTSLKHFIHNTCTSLFYGLCVSIFLCSRLLNSSRHTAHSLSSLIILSLAIYSITTYDGLSTLVKFSYLFHYVVYSVNYLFSRHIEYSTVLCIDRSHLKHFPST